MCYAEKYIHTQQDYEGLWEEDGCYNTSLYQKTAGYHTYQQVGEAKNNKDDHELATCNPRYFLHTRFLQFSTGMSVTMMLVAGLGLLGNTFSIIVLAR